jgi:triacylglycerol lipase
MTTAYMAVMKLRVIFAALATLGLVGCSGADVASDGQHVGEVERGTQYPIILAHGFDASPTNRWGFNGVAEALRAAGHTVYVATVPPYASVEDRAWVLADYVDEAWYDGHDKVNIIAHSMGGLDARYVVSGYGYGDIVASVSTISTPHRGSNVADGVLKILDGLNVDDELMNDVASLWGLTYNELAVGSDVRAALTAISEASAPGFNEDNRDDQRVFYQSWAGVSSVGGIKNWKDKGACDGKFIDGYDKADKMHATLVPMASLTAHGWHIYPNDGMVRVESAKWGEFHGCILADHLDEVGYQAEGPNERTGFDHLAFYVDIADGLVDRGF